ncbi:ABC transporter permease [Denitromonas sp.]|uniref:PhnE/PtxC family ABC transporter permease n=1 Tax=Denitromonas sp. TaxID=2734609 RepID=UPI002B0035F2|nr:ABC transporter permease [Denitromonas sp.]
MSTVVRDPAARGRATALVLGLCLLWPLLQIAEFNPTVLLAPGNLATLGGFLVTFLPPATDADFLGLLAAATVDTLAIATVGIALALLIAVPLALLATRSLSIGRLDARLHPVSEAVRVGARGLTLVLRGVPELVWALVFVRIFGLGPAAGVAALAITYGGMLAKVYSEILESTDLTPARALLAAGSGRLGALGYGLLPVASDELVSYTVYRWECAVRASVVMGFVGAGGLGQLMDQSMKMLNGGEACSILITFLLLVMAADALSAWLRRQVR